MMADNNKPSSQGRNSGERDIYSETVRVESKTFYVDLKENARGRYVKLSEKGANRPRSTVVVPASGLGWFAKLFDYYLQDPQTSGSPMNKELQVENKVFYFSVGQNPRGRFLRISESGIGNPAGRASLVIPSAGQDDVGWASFLDTIQRVCAIEQVPREEQAHINVGGTQIVVGPGPSPPLLTTSSSGAPVLRVGQKRFFFDVGENDKGRYLRITEVVRDDRSSLFLPYNALPKFQEALTACLNSPVGGFSLDVGLY